MKVRKKTAEVEAVQWFGEGDHPLVTKFGICQSLCLECRMILTDHGWLGHDTGRMVCPGDYIVENTKGGFSPIGADEFEKLYEFVNLDDGPNSDRCGVGISMGELSGLEVELKLEVNGQEGTCHLSPLFYEAIKEHWNKLTIEKYGMTYEQCLEEDQARFQSGLNRADALNTPVDVQSEDV